MKQLNKDARNFVDGIVDHIKRDNAGSRPFPKIQNLLRKVSDTAYKGNTAKITTAVPLSHIEKEQLTGVLSKKMNQQIALECDVRPGIIGGIRIEIADYVIDLSYEEKLRSITSLLLKGNRV